MVPRSVLFFLDSLTGAGAERTVVNLSGHWADQGCKVTVVTLSSRETDFYSLHPRIRRIALDLQAESPHPAVGALRNLQRLVALREVLQEVRPEVAVALQSVPSVLLGLAVVGLRGLRAVGSERIHPPRSPLPRAWELLRPVSYRSLTMVALTESSAHWVRTHTGARAVKVIPNALRWPLPETEPQLEPDSLVRPGRRMVLAVGRLEPQKGFDLLLEAFARIAEGMPDWDLVILGEGPLRATLEAQIRREGLGDRVRLPGRAGNMRAWYERAELFVLSSRFEGFPNVLLEAMAHGLPSVAFDCETGPAELVRSGENGLLVPAEDGGALVDAMTRLMEDEALRERCSSRAVEVRERYSMARVAAQWEAVFQG